jgi:hypothetical protein
VRWRLNAPVLLAAGDCRSRGWAPRHRAWQGVGRVAGSRPHLEVVRKMTRRHEAAADYDRLEILDEELQPISSTWQLVVSASSLSLRLYLCFSGTNPSKKDAGATA